ncbi:MAG: 6-bladed beta-propeller [Bacteroidales bacterium]
MLTNLIFCLALFATITLSCSKNINSTSSFTEINIEKKVGSFEKLQLSDYIDDIQYIPLDSDPVLLRSIYQLDFYRGMIAVNDKDNCILYDTSGGYIARIGNQGKGPGEYMFSTNFRFGINGKVYIQDGRDILIYDLNGTFIRKFDPEINTELSAVRNWSLYNDSLFLGQLPNQTGKEAYKAVIFDDRGKTIKTLQNWIFLNRESLVNSWIENHANIYQFNGKTFFKESINDTLFFINDQYLFEPAYYFKLGKYGEPVANRELVAGSAEWKSSANYIYNNNVYEQKNHFFIDLSFYEKHSPVKRDEPVEKYGTISEYYTFVVLGVFDKITKELAFSEPSPIDNQFLNTGLYNDFDGGLNFYPKERVNDSILAMWIDAYIIKEHVDSDAFKNSNPKYPEKKKELEVLAARLAENDNPVLMLVKLKE